MEIFKNIEMEERAWDLVEKFISGEASEKELRELQGLLIKDHEIHIIVREFLDTYEDPDPQITEEEKIAFLNRIAAQAEKGEQVG